MKPQRRRFRAALLVFLLTAPVAARAGFGLSSLTGEGGIEGDCLTDPTEVARYASTVGLDAVESLLNVTTEDCTDEQRARVLRGIAQFMDRVDQCLNVLNPSLAQAIYTHYAARPKMNFRCEAATGIAGGHTHRGARDISVVFRSGGGGAGSISDYSMAARIFHESIHVCDSSHHHISYDRAPFGHSLGFPDPTYSCQYACMGEVGREEADALNRAGASEIPPIDTVPSFSSRWASVGPADCQSDTVSDPYDRPACMARRRFATACALDRTPWTCATERMRTEAGAHSSALADIPGVAHRSPCPAR
ncbi:MAG: hypothetical protein IT285_14435 [Bdellovibrionales bacterium]|nr:hypothetical protein [Bdellovibrionales bacterium]